MVLTLLINITPAVATYILFDQFIYCFLIRGFYCSNLLGLQTRSRRCLAASVSMYLCTLLLSVAHPSRTFMFI